ncbi:MAG: hypothetical protein ACJ768_05965 [Gaiellaceae bacterium]
MRVVSGKGPKPVQGPGSDAFKFEPSLCARCNNERSQPFDLAYDTFTNYLRDNETMVFRGNRTLNLSAIWANWQQSAVDLLRYYTKHIGCRLAEAHVEVRPEVISFLDDQGPMQSLAFMLEVRRDIVAMTKYFTKKDGYFPSLWIGDLAGFKDAQTGDLERIESFHGYRWLRTNWVYDDSIPAEPNPFPTPEYELGTDYNVNPLGMRLVLAVGARPRLAAIVAKLQGRSLN